MRPARTRIQDTWSGHRARIHDIQDADVRLQNPETSLQIPGFDNPVVGFGLRLFRAESLDSWIYHRRYRFATGVIDGVKW